MLVFTLHAGIYDACWYLRWMLVFALHAGIYDACWYLRCMLIFALHAGIYDGCWYLRCMLVFTMDAGICRCMLVFTMHAGIWLHACLHLRCFRGFTKLWSLFMRSLIAKFLAVIHYGIAKFIHSVMFLSECIVNTYQHAAQISTCIVNTSMQRKYQHAL